MMFDSASLFNETYDLVYNTPDVRRTSSVESPEQPKVLLRIDQLLQKKSSLTANEKKQIFGYVQDGNSLFKQNQSNQMRETYVKNVIMIVDSLFSYGYLPSKQQNTSTSKSITQSFTSGLSSVTSTFTSMSKSLLSSQ